VNVDAIPKRPLCERVVGLGALAVNAPGDCCQSLYKLSIPCKTCFKPGEEERCSSRTAEDLEEPAARTIQEGSERRST
jgi:hypothetical protein